MPRQAQAQLNGDPASAKAIQFRRYSSSPASLKRRKARGEDVSEISSLARISSTQTRIMLGEENLGAWDSEELRRGRKRDKDGGFRGRQPEFVHRKMLEEMTRRQDEAVQQKLDALKMEAVRQLEAVLTGVETPDKERLEAIKMIFAHATTTPGQVEEKENAGIPKWAEAIDAGIVVVDDAIETTAVELPAPSGKGGSPVADVEAVGKEDTKKVLENIQGSVANSKKLKTTPKKRKPRSKK